MATNHKAKQPVTESSLQVAITGNKRFDTRILDRLEGYAFQYRHWLNYSGDLPASYVEKEREKTAIRLRKTCYEAIHELDEYGS